jgi:hypothetical protein
MILAGLCMVDRSSSGKGEARRTAASFTLLEASLEEHVAALDTWKLPPPPGEPHHMRYARPDLVFGYDPPEVIMSRHTPAIGILLTLVMLALPSTGMTQPPAADREEWLPLFNGRNLDGWTPKFTRHPLGENLNDTVRVEDGLLKIRYDKWTAFNGEFGHVFYATPFSYYRLVAEYRFVGEPLKGGAGWAMRNNGLMLHAPDPKTMLLDQDFPISLEMQLLGGLGDGKPRTTANLCTPGTHVVMNGAVVTAHCVNSTSKTYDGDQWVRVEVEVLGGERIRHVVDGQTVLEYSKPQVGGGNVNAADPAVKVDGTPLTGGFIAVQAETAPIDFRKLELLNLEGCMDPEASNYKSYFVKSNPAACRH